MVQVLLLCVGGDGGDLVFVNTPLMKDPGCVCSPLTDDGGKEEKEEEGEREGRRKRRRREGGTSWSSSQRSTAGHFRHPVSERVCVSLCVCAR